MSIDDALDEIADSLRNVGTDDLAIAMGVALHELMEGVQKVQFLLGQHEAARLQVEYHTGHIALEMMRNRFSKMAELVALTVEKTGGKVDNLHTPTAGEGSDA